MNLSGIPLACLAIISILVITSGELIPGRIQAPRVKRESVRHVRGHPVFEHAGSHVEMHRPTQARYVRRPSPVATHDFQVHGFEGSPAYEKIFQAFLDRSCQRGFCQVIPDDEKTETVEDEEDEPEEYYWLPARETPTEDDDDDDDEEYYWLPPTVRKRRRMESIQGKREASREPSGSRRQPIRRSAAPRSPPGPGQ